MTVTDTSNNERDELTGLFTSRYAMAKLEAAIIQADQQGGTVGILFTDIDRCKYWNDRYGHTLGDVMIRLQARLTQELIGNKGIVSRYGGDEFFIVLPAISSAETTTFAHKLHQQVANQRIPVEGHDEPSATMTVAVALYPEHGEDAISVLSAADEAVHQAKHSGGNRVVLAERWSRGNVEARSEEWNRKMALEEAGDNEAAS